MFFVSHLHQSSISIFFKQSKYQTNLLYIQSNQHPIDPLTSLPTMRSFTLPIVFGLLATMCHAAPFPVQPEARQTTTLFLTFFGAGENPPSYDVEVTLESQENFQSFTISKSLPSNHSRSRLLVLSCRVPYTPVTHEF